MVEEKNSSKFLRCFNEIEGYLKKTYPNLNESSFTCIINNVKKKNIVINKHCQDLYEFSELRNAIVHQYKDFVIAEPHDTVIVQISKILESLKNPPMVRDILKNKDSPLVLNPEILLEEALKKMINKNYSQFPIVDGKNVLGVLTSNTITRYLGINTSKDFFEVLNEKVSNVLQYAEYENFNFIKIDSNIYNILNKFENFLIRGKQLDALLVTQNGINNETLLGILTIWDLQEIYKIIK